MSAPWWAALMPVSTTLGCDGTHRLRWEDGRLWAVDHPDAESEMVLAALGGDEPECLRKVSAWGQHSDNLDALAIGPRSADDDFRVSPAGLETERQRRLIISRLRPGPAPDRARDRRTELYELFSLGLPFTFRLMATVAASWADRPQSARPALTAALSGRLAPAVSTWLRMDADRVDARIYEGSGWGELARTADLLHAALPLGWIAGVWAAGLAVVDRKLVVEVVSVTGSTAEVLAVSRPGAQPEPLTVVLRSGQWRPRSAERRRDGKRTSRDLPAAHGRD